MIPEIPKYYFIGILNILYEAIIQRNHHISWYSVMSCLICLSLILSVFILVSTIPAVRRVIGIRGVVGLSVFGMLLLFVPMDVPWQITVVSQRLKPLGNMLRYHITEDIRLQDLVIMIWVAGIFFSTIFYMISEIRSRFILKRLPMKEMDIDEAIKPLLPKRTLIRICYGISVPVSIRGLNKAILLPARSYNDNELRHIILHEAAHLRSFDHIIITLCDLLCMIYWWNPAVRLLRKSIEKNLEFRCDESSIRNMSREDKADYMNTLLNVFKGRYDGLNSGLGLLGGNHSKGHDLKERFLMIESGIDGGRHRIPLWVNIFTICVMGALLIFSYSFSFTPLYFPGEYESDIIDPSGNLIYTGDTLYPEMEHYIAVDEGSYIIDHGGNMYTLKNVFGEQTVPDDWVDILSESGVEVVTAP